jgi:hypothetical protein
MKKSCLSGYTFNKVMSGIAITTYGFPPYFSNFACGSPNVLDTDNLPG